MTSVFSILKSFILRRELRQDLLQGAQELYRQAVSGNSAAINEIEKGLLSGSGWDYAGIITKNSHNYIIIDTDKELTSSGPIPFLPLIKVK